MASRRSLLSLFAVLGVLAGMPSQAAVTTYTGTFSGTIAAGDTALLNDGASVSGNVANSGTLQFNISGSSAVANNAIISGTGVVRMTGSGTVSNLFDAQTYTGRTLLENGTLLINFNDRLGNTSSGVTFDGGRLQITNSGVNSTFSTARAMSLVSAGTIDTSTLADGSYDQPAFTGVVSGTGTLTLAANGLGNGASDAYLRFGGASTYSGTTRITSGVVYASSTSAFGTSTVVLDGGGLVAPSAVTVNNAIVLAGTANSVRAWSSQTMNLGGVISGTGGLQKTDNGTVNLNSANTYTGDTRILAGTLNAANYSALAGTTLDMQAADAGSIGFTVAQTGTYQIAGLTGSRAINNGGDTLAIGGNGASTTYSGTLSGAGGLIKVGDGTLTLTGNSSYTGVTELQGGTLALGSAGAIGSSGTISFTGGTLQYSAANTTDYSSRFSTAAGQDYSIDTNGQNVTFANPLNSSGGSLTKLGAGVLNLTDTTVALNTVVLDFTTNVSGGGLQAVGGGAALRIGNSGTGTLNLTGGSVTNSLGYLGVFAGSVGTATVSSGTWANSGELVVGYYLGTGTLNVTGGRVTNGVGIVGNASSVGTATVSSGTWANSGDLFVGSAGTGTLNVTGGLVTNSIGVLGALNGSVGTATVSSGTWANSGDLVVGSSGTGTLNVTGGSVTNTRGFLGTVVGTVGTATVSSGTWANSGDLVVGNYGTGTLNVTGGRVTNSIGFLGSFGGGVGTATVSSGTWASSGDLVVGSYGTGTLNVTGGSVTNTRGFLGSLAGSVGTATVSSGTWANSSDLLVGVSGTGTLTMSGGLVTVAGVLSRGTNGTINLDAGGTLQIGTGGVGGWLGVSTLTNNGTLIFNRSNASTYSGIISGSGAFTKQGAGTLTLSGNNTYTGPTVVSGGTVSLQGAGDISSSSGVDLASGAALVVGSASGDRTLQMLTGSAGSFVDVGSRTLTVGNASSGTFAGGMAGSGGGLTKAGSGSLTLSGSNSFTGQTTVSAGTLVLDSGNALAPTAAVVVNSSATLQANQPIRIGYLDSSGTVIGGGNLSSTLTVTRSGNIGGIANGTDSQGTFAAGIAKLGTGTSTVNQANTYTGLTWVREGTLAMGVSNAFAAASDLTVDSGATFDRAGFSQTVTNAVVNGGVGNSSAGGLLTVTGTLSGSGSVNGATLVNRVHAPGNSPGIQTFNGDLTYVGGAAVEWELASNTTGDPGTNYDQIVLPTGNLLFSGSTTLDLSFDGADSTVAWSDPFWDSDRAWMVYDLGTGTTTGFASLLLGGSLLDSLGNALLETRGAFSTSLVGQDVFLSYTAVPVPEPSSYAMALAGLACGGYSLFRRRKRA
jgi:autotransporter-associated beta strand protein/T5SS/PEP-CTERM-associated repeat protein